jgi:hypothetical protein
MGITIHYSGKIDNKSNIPKMVDEMMDFAEISGWDYRIINDTQLTGIVLYIHPDSESFSLTFDEKGELKSYLTYRYEYDKEIQEEINPLFVKTQFAGIQTHITIIRLLQFIKNKYISNLNVRDEGEFWNTGDLKLLREKFTYLKRALKKTKSLFLTDKLSKGIENDEQLLDRIETLIKRAFGNQEQIPVKNLKKIWGENAIFSKVGKYTLVHLDNPSEEQIKERIEKAKNGEYDDFDDDCPLCQAMKDQPCEIVFDCSYWCPECDPSRRENCEFYQTKGKELFKDEIEEDSI